MQYLLLAVVGAALWIHPFINGIETGWETNPVSPLFSLLQSILPMGNSLVSLLAFIILLLEGLYLNHVLIKHDLVAKNTLFTAFVYIILMSQSPQVLTLNPALCAAFFVIPALDLILGTYGDADPTRSVFNAALLLGVASLFHFAFVFLVLVLLLSFMVFGTFSLRIFLVSLAGLSTVYLYLFVYYFLIDNTGGQAEIYLNWFVSIPKLNLDFPFFQYAVWVMQDLLFLAAFFAILNHMGEWNISVRKIMLLIIYYALIALFSFVYILDDIQTGGLVTAIPFTIFIAAFLSSRKRLPYLLELYFLLWYALTFANNIFLAHAETL
jgi:hypothetical protein